MTRILLVDNEPSIRRLLRLMLTRAGHEVVEVRGGATAFTWMQASDEPAIVLLSTMMPCPAIEAIVQAAARGDVPQPCACILLTATPEHLPPALMRLIDAYAIPVVGAPFASAALFAAVTQAQESLEVAATTPHTV